MTIQGIVFDKDGVFVDFDRTWAPALKVVAGKIAAGDELLERHYLDVAGYELATDTFSAGSVWAAGNTTDLVEAWLPKGTADARLALARQVDDYCASCEPVPLLPTDQLQEIFGALKSLGFKLGVATNDSEISARRTVERFGLQSMFELVVGYDSVERPKPAPDPVRKFSEHTEIEVSKIAMVGDNIHDAEMARAAGTGLAIGVLSGNSSRQDLLPHVDHVIDTIADLNGILPALVR